MDSDRKYRQHGYNDNDHHSNGHGNGNGNGQRPKPSGPRPPIDITGPRLPRLVQAVTASRCYQLRGDAAAGHGFHGNVPEVRTRRCTAASNVCILNRPPVSSA